MRDHTSKKGFFSLTKMKNWLTKLLINLNPPLRRVPVRHLSLVPIEIERRSRGLKERA